MKNKKMIMQIIFILIAGLCTVGLSIYSVLESSKKEVELKNTQSELKGRQDFLIELQEKYAKELKEKTDKVIELQKLLQGKSDLQLSDLDRLKNPIPDVLDISFNTSLELDDNEIFQIIDIIKKTKPNHDNLLPIDVERTNLCFEKINSFKNIHLRITIKFIKADKEMSIFFNRAPLNLYGYNTTNTINSFTLYMNSIGDRSIVRFNGLSLDSEKITTNYKSPSIRDFENSKILITYEFSYPELFMIGGKQISRYVSSNKFNINLNLETLILSDSNYKIEISGIKKIERNNFEGYWIVKN